MISRAQSNNYLVVSDLHLSDVEDHPDGWKYYKGSKFLWDDVFASVVERYVDQAEEGANLTLILNGDIIDFDIITSAPEDPPWPVSAQERRHCLDANEPKSVWKLEQVLAAHPVWVSTLARFVATGHRLVAVMGNHDRELHFQGVQDAFREALEKAAEEEGLALQADRLQFEPWFFAVPGEIYVEHGQQYDYYTSFRNVLRPLVRVWGEDQIALPMGNLANRFLMSRMGFFNPHAGAFILNLFSYFTHWYRYYAFSKRNLVLPWFVGSLLVIWKLLVMKQRLLFQLPGREARSRSAAIGYGLDIETVAALARLSRPPITSRFYRIIREFWIDRLIIAVVMTVGTILLFALSAPLWAKIMVPFSSFPLLYFIYEWLAQGETVYTVEKRLPEMARAIVDLVPVRVVAFGHTHVPRLIPLDKNVYLADTGTWAPITEPDDDEVLVPGFRNYLYVSFRDGEDPVVRLDSA